jgi:hypothetical protein
VTETPKRPGLWEARNGTAIYEDGQFVAMTKANLAPMFVARLNAHDELVAALEGTVSWCPMCAGTGRYTPYCVRCEDSTDDHYCPSSKPCFQCRDARALLARVRGEEIQG